MNRRTTRSRATPSTSIGRSPRNGGGGRSGGGASRGSNNNRQAAANYSEIWNVNAANQSTSKKTSSHRQGVGRHGIRKWARVDRAPAGTTFTVKIWVPIDELALDERIKYGIPDEEEEDEVIPETLPPEEPTESLVVLDTSLGGEQQQQAWPAQLASAELPNPLPDAALRIPPSIDLQPTTMSSDSIDETSGDGVISQAVINPVAVGESTIPLRSDNETTVEEPPAKRSRMGDNINDMDGMTLVADASIESSAAVIDPGNLSRQSLQMDSVEGKQNATER
jgi:hypothetical protein